MRVALPIARTTFVVLKLQNSASGLGDSLTVTFKKVPYGKLNSRQKEIFNFQKVSGLLASYGFATYRLTDDWNGADFIAVHVDGKTFLRVQLKSRFHIAKKYMKKDVWVCFRHDGLVWLYPHDQVVEYAKRFTDIHLSRSWIVKGGYSATAVPKDLREIFDANYCLGYEAEPA